MLTPSGKVGAWVPPGPNRLVGTLVAGKYRLKRLLGHGGMGSVYKAEHIAIGRAVAVKILHLHLADDGVVLARFQREARVAASAGHPNVVEMLDMGVEPSGAPYLVMEYVRGQNLATLLRMLAASGAGPMPIERAVRIAGQLLSGLAAMHERGIIHRDLKPENVMLTTKNGVPDFVKILDFGVATFVEACFDPNGPIDLTPSGRTMGTPWYASPEQIDGARGRDERVDLWAVGVMLYEMVAGRRPFDEPRFPDLCKAILERTPQPLTRMRSDVPPGLEQVVARALAKDPDARFRNAAEMAAALVPFGATPIAEEPEPTDTFTWDMRELRAREALLGRPDGRLGVQPSSSSQGGGIRGEVVDAIREYLRDRLGGPRYERLLDDADPAIARVLRGRIDREAWYPDELLALVERADREYAAGDRKLIAEVGRLLARRVFAGSVVDASAPAITPELLFSMAADLWSRFFAGGEAKVTHAGRGLGRLEVASARPSLAHAVAMLGILDEGIALAGGGDVDVRLAAAAALGDPADVYEATWS